MPEPRRLTRREAIRKGAVVGGHLLWIAPAIQTLTPKAFAQTTSPVFTCCSCTSVSGTGANPCEQCFAQDPTILDADDCTAKCASLSTPTRTCGTKEFQTNTTGFECSGNNCQAL